MNNITAKKSAWYAQLRKTLTEQINHEASMLPDSLEEAYQIQAQVIEALGRDVKAWKIGGTNAKTIAAFNCTEGYFGPVFADKVFAPQQPVLMDDLLEVKGEAEFAFRLSAAVDDCADYTTLSLEQLIDGVAPSLEMPSACFADMKVGGVELLVADLCGSGALVHGDFEPFELALINDAVPISLNQSGTELARGDTSVLIPNQREVLTEFFALAQRYGVKLKAGQIVVTGGCTSCEALTLEQPVVVSFAGYPEIEFTPHISTKK